MFIPESTAGQIGRDYQKLEKETLKAAVFAPLAINKLLAQLLARLEAKKGLVEIKIDGKLAFKGRVGEKPLVNKLTDEHLERLNQVINTPIANKLESINISVDGETVYASHNGSEQVNKLKISSSKPTLSGAMGLRAAIAARQILDSKNVDTYENDTYRIERENNSITLTAKDGRGQILNAGVENLQAMIPQQNSTVEMERD